MATENCITDGYTLSPEVAASLRVPCIDYPNGIVPHRVVLATVLRTGSLSIQDHPELAGDVPLDRLLALLRKNSH